MPDNAFPAIAAILWDCERQEFRPALISHDSATGMPRLLGMNAMNALRLALSLANVAQILLEVAQEQMTDLERQEVMDGLFPYKTETMWGEQSVILWSPVALADPVEG